MKNVEGIFIGGSFAAIVDWFYCVGDFDCVAVRGDALLWCGEHSVFVGGAGAV